jgi:hypothetical protein
VALVIRVDPIGAPAATSATVRERREAGANVLMTRFVHESLAHYLEQLEAMTDIVSSL